MEIKIVFDNATIYADLIDQKLKVYTKNSAKFLVKFVLHNLRILFQNIFLEMKIYIVINNY